ncbi:hypothetical protein KAI04_04280 [Candidatus Pacearchaeota archaeon]|nr:hypothetical protein [Candidatus Pacearchaeota archaeon]
MGRYAKQLEQIIEESKEHPLEVWDIFSECIYRVYSRDLKEGERFKVYDEKLDAEALIMTDKYFKIFGSKYK